MSALHELRATIARLRAPDGCPWDQEQTHESLVRCLIDEVSELIDTIDRADSPHMREELGDVLIQVYFHAQIAEEAGQFDLEDVARDVNEKLVRRHPQLRGRLLTLGVFFYAPWKAVYVVVPLLAWLAWAMPAALLVLPAVLVARGMQRTRSLDPRRLAMHALRVLAHLPRMVILNATLLYGSIRFRSLVL